MTITQIECFVEAARMKSLSKAADNIYISQPAISRQIKALETDLGFSLFERKNIGVKLTPMGEILYAEWKEMLLIHRSAVDKAKDLYYGEEKNLKIGILDFAGSRDHIINTLIRYNQKYPELDVEYKILQMPELLKGIENNELHMIVTYVSEIENAQALKTLYLDEIPMRVGLIYSRSHPLTKLKQVNISDIQGETIGVLASEASVDHKNRIMKLLDENHLTGQVALREFSSRHNLQMALITGKCITVMYESVTAGLEDQLLFYPLDVEDDISKIVIAWKNEKYAIKARNIAQFYE